MAATTKTHHPDPQWMIYDATTRRHVAIDLDEAELLPSETVVQMFWSKAAGRYVTIPGDSLYTVQADGSLVLDDD
jgi:hypothetical protein